MLHELVELKDSMSKVLAEVGRCMASIESLNVKVSDAVTRLEIVTDIVKATDVGNKQKNINPKMSSKNFRTDDITALK